MTKEISNCQLIEKYRSILDGLYLLLCVDQLPEGIWGYSIPMKDQPSFTYEKLKGSPTVSVSAASALAKYTGDDSHGAIQEFLRFVELSHNTSIGAYGRSVIYTSDPDVQPNVYVVPNSRHTARFVWFLISTKGFSKSVIDSVSFLIRNQKHDGWVINPTDLRQTPDPLTVAYVLQTLFEAERGGISNILGVQEGMRLRISQKRGLSWLAENCNDGFWIFGQNFRKRYQYTGIVLTSVPELNDEYPAIYGHAFERMYEEAKKNGMLFLNLEESSIDFGTSILFWSLICERPNFQQKSELLLENLMSCFQEQKHLLATQAPDWAFLLDTLVSANPTTKISKSRRDELDATIDPLLRNLQSVSLAQIQAKLPEDVAWISPIIVSNIAYSVPKNSVKDPFEQIKRDLLSLLNKEMDELAKDLANRLVGAREYSNQMAGRYGNRSRQRIVKLSKTKYEEEHKELQAKYDELRNKIEKSKSLGELESIRLKLRRGSFE